MEWILKGIAKEVKNTVRDVRIKVYKKVYKKLDMKEVEKYMYRITQVRKRNSRDLLIVKCAKDENKKFRVWDEGIEERWKDFFDRLFIGSFT